MTKTQIWLSGFVILFIALFMLGRLTKKETPESEMMQTQMMQKDSKDASVEQMLTSLSCTKCHGGDLKGTGMAPTLYGLKAGWNRDNLINYLRNPSSYMSSDKFKVYKEKYKNVMMPAFNNVDVKELGKIADYLLNLQ